MNLSIGLHFRGSTLPVTDRHRPVKTKPFRLSSLLRFLHPAQVALHQSPQELFFTHRIDVQSEFKHVSEAIDFMASRHQFNPSVLSKYVMANWESLVRKPDAVYINGTNIQGTVHKIFTGQSTAIPDVTPALVWMNTVAVQFNDALPETFGNRLVLNEAGALVGVLFAAGPDKKVGYLVPAVNRHSGVLTVDADGHTSYQKRVGVARDEKPAQSLQYDLL